MADGTNSGRVLKLCDEALSRADDERDAFLSEACSGDTRLRASVDSVMRAVSEAGDFLSLDDADADAAAPLTGQRIGHFRVLEKLGEGGMGTVYLAEREGDEFQQRVAIKVVRSHLLAKAVLERFSAERKFLAALNHPYIAGLVDGGTTDDGAPYLVMEYIEGVPIDRYCDENQFTIAQRIRLVQKVAMAVHVAHQNLIVHRDLKPSNVLVTPDGIPKLLDFGIAKLVSANSAASPGSTTLFGQQAMTPNYASPEQVLEGTVTTASDVYSLGVLAYELLAGEQPYSIPSSNHKEMIDSFESLTVPRASMRVESVTSQETATAIAKNRSTTFARLKKNLAGDLDNILGKALQQEPERRYSSVANLSADLDRFLQGMPIEARADSLGYRMSRFVSRHKFGVAVSIAGLTLLMAGFGATYWAYLDAERARAVADERFEQVRSIANTLMFDVFDAIEKVPGTNSARETVASTAQTYLESLADVPGASADVKLEAAQGFSRLAHIFSRQAVAVSENREMADIAQQKSRQMLEALTKTHPDPARVFRSLAKLQSDAANVYLYVENEPVKAREELTRSLESFAQAARSPAADQDLQAERFLAVKRMADSFKWENNLKQAVNQGGSLLAEIESARAAAPDHLGLLKMHADAFVFRGEVSNYSDQFEQGAEDLGKAIALYRRHVELAGDSLAIDNALVIAYWVQGTALTQLDRAAESLPSFDNALDLLDVQQARDPNDSNVSRRIAILKGTKSQALAGMEKYDEALDIMLEANEWFEAQVVADPNTAVTHRSAAVGYQVIADLYRDAGRLGEACVWWQKTLDKWLAIDARFALSDFDKPEPDKLRESLLACG